MGVDLLSVWLPKLVSKDRILIRFTIMEALSVNVCHLTCTIIGVCLRISFKDSGIVYSSYRDETVQISATRTI